MNTSTDWKCYIVTDVPVFRHSQRLYWEDVWERDVMSRKPLWEQVILISPLKESEKLQPVWNSFPGDSVPYYPIDGSKSIHGQRAELKAILHELLGDSRAVYEFAGCSALGRYGFILAGKLGEGHRAITFDAPIHMLKLQLQAKKGLLSIPKRIIAPSYFRHVVHFRRWCIENALASVVIGNGIAEEIGIRDLAGSRVLSVILSLDNEDSILSNGEFESIWNEKGNRKCYVVMCADRFAVEKGVFEFVKALDVLDRGVSSIKLQVLLFSDGPIRRDVMDYVRSHGLDRIVTYRGRVTREELISSMRSCDLFVTLTKTLDFNRTMIDAAGQGCAILASDSVGPRSFFRNGESAWLVDPNRPDEISRAIVVLLGDYGLRVSLARNALAIARNNTAIKVKSRIKDWYMKAVDEIGIHQNEIARN